jgi:hypothetical protein
MHVAPPKEGRSIPTKLVAQIAKGGASGACFASASGSQADR